MLRQRFALVTLVWSTAAAPVAAQQEVIAELPGAGRAVDHAVYHARRADLAARIGNGVAVVLAAERRSLEAEVLQDRDFRQDDYFYYLSGLETPGAGLVLGAAEGRLELEVLLLPPAQPFLARWLGVQLAPGPRAAELSGIPLVLSLDSASLDSVVTHGLVRAQGPLWLSLPQRSRAGSWVAALGHSGEAAARQLRPVLDSMRLVKDSLELSALERAVAITTAGIEAGMRSLRPGQYEYQLEAEIEYTFRWLGADRVGFPSIVGSGPNSVILHHDVNRRRMEAGDLVVVDVGAEYAQYTADITRTLPVSGRFTERQREVYDLVLGAQEAVIASVRPGVTLRDLHQVAREHFAQHGKTVCGAESCTRFFIHGVGHWLGMRVHDVGDRNRPLEPGMVLTVEPGLYFPEEGLGVRIEDDVLVTHDGARLLSAGLPRSADEIERVMQAARGDSESKG